ncbi:hypothetical protein FKM82_014253 [Ascaphus truei]
MNVIQCIHTVCWYSITLANLFIFIFASLIIPSTQCMCMIDKAMICIFKPNFLDHYFQVLAFMGNKGTSYYVNTRRICDKLHSSS